MRMNKQKNTYIIIIAIIIIIITIKQEMMRSRL